MKKEEFFPKVAIVGSQLHFNAEAIETMDLDSNDAKVILVEVVDPEKKLNNREILIMKVNGSLCDDPENIKDAFPPDRIRPVTVKEDGSGVINITSEVSNAINEIFGSDKNDFKLLVCNKESPLGKEFKEQFDITTTYYRFAYINDKRISVGKEKPSEKSATTERVSIN